jgi:membrane-associated protein
MDFFWQLVEYLTTFVQTVINLSPETINQYANDLGHWLYVVLFLIIFAETGLVVTPFLPGDSLLFAVGAVAAHPQSPIQLGLMALMLVVAAVLGDAVNYAVGFYVGPRVFSREDSWLLNKKHLLRAHRFYEEYGGLTIILARFIPIVRTFAPFVAGIGKMSYPRFALFNVMGGTVWILCFLLAGWLFGGSEYVQKNFKLVIVAIIVISVLPGVYEYVRVRFDRKRLRSEPGEEVAAGLRDSTEESGPRLN